jgi:RNA polymerase sigma-70 factor (ECF subfamily)
LARSLEPVRRSQPAIARAIGRPIPAAAGEIPAFGDNYGVDSRAARPADQPLTAIAPIADADERELVASILRRDRKAAARFVAAHADAVYAYARHRLAPRADLVDDVVQDVFLAALNGLATFQGQSSLRGWLIGIARHKIEDVYRQRLRVPDALDDLDAVSEEALSTMASLDEQIDAARMRTKTREVLAQLPERYGLVLLWRYWERRSAREVAAAIGTTEKSVERLLARARARFKELWSKE